jgi:hypothetical protein
VSYKLFSRNVFRMPTSVMSPPTVGKVLHPTLWSKWVQASSKRFRSFRLTSERRMAFMSKNAAAQPPATSVGVINVLFRKETSSSAAFRGTILGFGFSQWKKIPIPQPSGEFS